VNKTLEKRIDILKMRVVLVRPRDPNNIGACARAMANFGFSDLVVLDPYEPIWQETRSAPGAEAIVLNAKKVKTFEQALRGCPLVLGTSSFHQRTLEHAIIDLSNLSLFLNKQKSTTRVALVMGSERSGLSNDELSQCHSIIRIPTLPAQPSMNLAQALAVILYELSQQNLTSKPSLLKNVSSQEKNGLISLWISLAEKTGYPPGYTPAARTGRIRKVLNEVSLTPESLRFQMSFLRWLLKHSKSD